MSAPGRSAILSWRRWSEPSAIVSSPSRKMTYSPCAMSIPVFREAEHEPLRGPVNILKRGSRPTYSRTTSSVLSLEVSTPSMHSQSVNGCFSTESRQSRRYGSTSQHGTMMEKNGFMFGGDVFTDEVF